MKKSLIEKAGIFLVIVMLISLLLSFEKIGDTVGGWFGAAAGKVSTVSRVIFGSALGLYLITTGVAAMAVPVIGIALVVIGVALLAYSLWPYFKKKPTE